MSETNLETGGETMGWEALARAAADGAADAEGVDELLQLLRFEIDGAPYAVPVERVREIVRMRSITPVPRMPDDVRGVISLRGEIIEVIDLRRRLGLEAVEPTRRTRIIVAHNSDGQLAAILVDAVREVLRMPADSVQPSSASDSGAIEALCACNDEFVSLVELDRVLAIDA